jgi:hypothetical protein
MGWECGVDSWECVRRMGVWNRQLGMCSWEGRVK